MVYRESIKQEIEQDSTYDGQSEVGSKKLIIRPSSSSRDGARVGRRKFDNKDTDNNNNDDDVDIRKDHAAGCDGSWLPGGAVSKKLIIKPSVSRIDAEVAAPAVVEVVSGRYDAAIDNEDTNSCELPDSTSGLKDITGNTESFSSETAQSTEVVIDVGETDEQAASGSVTRKGRKPGKKSAAAAGSKGIDD